MTLSTRRNREAVKKWAVMLIPPCGRSICIYLLENKQLQILLPQGGIRMTGIVDFFTASDPLPRPRLRAQLKDAIAAAELASRVQPIRCTHPPLPTVVLSGA
jgi:hypothetical protein